MREVGMKKEEQKVTEQKAEKKDGKKPFYRKFIFGAGISTIAGVGILYFCFVAYFQSHFCYGTVIGGIDAGGKTVEEVKQEILEETRRYKLILAEREGKTEEISGSSISLQPVFSGEIEQLFARQNEFAWPLHAFDRVTLDLEKTVAYDEAELEKVIGELNGIQPENQREPVNASCSEYTEAGYVLSPADYGTVIDREKFTAAVGAAVLSLTDRLDLDEADCYVDPAVGDDHAELLAMLDKLNTYVSTTIRYDVGEEKEVLDGALISEWLRTDENFQVTVDAEAVASYVKELADKYNTVYKAKKLKTSYNDAEVTITACPYGWKLDNSGEAAQIMADLESGGEIKREPVFAQKANSHGENDYGDSYVEINLTAQHLFLYKEGRLIVESDFVSGCVAKGYATPPGAYPVNYITRDAVLRGEDYVTPVNFWMPFNGGIGMHDLTSRRAFGGDIYKRNGSHGCINLPYTAAQTIFENIEAGFPVLLYELPGSQSESVKRNEAITVVNLINSIGIVTLESETVIVSARNLYNALDANTKTLVTNYDVLVNAEALLAQMKAAADAVIPPPDAELPVEQPVTQ